MLGSLAHARSLLHAAFGYRDFRPLQSRIIHHVLAGRDVLAVLPTGGGKSLCFQVPALASPGLTIVVSPLIALMEDQVGALVGRGIAAAALNSTQDVMTQASTMTRARDGSLRLLYVSPERLPRLVDELRVRRTVIARLAVDEAHCIVEWGHDFRPSYRALRDARVALQTPPCVALTGSATPDARREIQRALGFRADAREIVGSFDRPNLWFEVVPVSGRDERVARLVRLVRGVAGSAIIYAPTRGLVEGVCRVLVENGVSATAYHAGMAIDARAGSLQRFMAGESRVMVATCAFGMGIDKAAVRLVAHWSLPATPESYYQEAGRAGRDREPARCVLFHHGSDAALLRRQLATTFPPEALVQRLWQDPGLRSRHPAAIVAAADRLAIELRPDRGPVEWSAVRRRRREAGRRLDAMVKYGTSRTCRRDALLSWFGERIDRCGNCDRCAQSPGKLSAGRSV